MSNSKRASLSHARALVTGASGGIGGAIAVALAECGAIVHAVGRQQSKLDALRARTSEAAGRVHGHQVDLTSDDAVAEMLTGIAVTGDRLDILVHCAGGISYGTIAESSVQQLDELYALNVRAPYALTKRCLPSLLNAQGQIAFINSSAGLAASAGVGQYAASKHALKAIADSLRDELNAQGVRVLSIFPGRTATALMLERFAMEGRTYHPELLLQPEDIAEVLVNSLLLPRTAEVTNISVRPLAKSY